MSERVQRQRVTPPQRVDESPLVAPQADTSSFDALLDEIDTVLESDAEDYVKGFVQKGGQ